MSRPLIVLVAALLYVLYTIGLEPAKAEPPIAASGWETDLLAAIGNSAPTAETVAYLAAWARAENTAAAFNPLATTHGAAGDSCFNYLNGRCGVRNYPDYQTGIDAIAATLANGRYPNTLAGLQTNAPIVDDGEMATWGTGGGAIRDQLRQAPAPATSDTRAQLVDYALSLQGIPYVRGGRSASGGDCSGTMQHIYLTIAGVDIGGTTFSQYPGLQPIELADAQPGDLWYGQYADDQHTGMLADVDGDGRWDLINNGGLSSDMHIDYDFLSIDYFNQHTMGFRRAL